MSGALYNLSPFRMCRECVLHVLHRSGKTTLKAVQNNYTKRYVLVITICSKIFVFQMDLFKLFQIIHQNIVKHVEVFTIYSVKVRKKEE